MGKNIEYVRRQSWKSTRREMLENASALRGRGGGWRPIEVSLDLSTFEHEFAYDSNVICLDGESGSSMIFKGRH
jgi:hypothetical protein